MKNFLPKIGHFAAIVMFIVLLMSSCQTESDIADIDRPTSPWVFRSVLDGNPRMITLALDKDLWVSYHTETGALYKAWKGNANMVGAVYDMAHGPQPMSQGADYFENTHKKPWTLIVNGKEIETKCQYKGHRLVNGHAELMYELTGNGKVVTVHEMPERKTNDLNQNIFSRQFTVDGLDAPTQVKLKTNVGPIIIESNVITNGQFDILNNNRKQDEKVELMYLDGSLTISKNGVTDFDVILSNKGLIPNENNLPIEEGDEDIATNNGAKLIAKSDCKTCHNKKVKTIGPSYNSIAEKYKNTETNVEYLIGKIKKGGSGVWGEQLMTAHPGVPLDDIRAMVDYIMKLDASDDQGMGDANSQEVEDLVLQESSKNVVEENLLPGSIVKVYDIDDKYVSIKDLSGKKPRYGGVLPDFDNLDGSDWNDLTEFFALEARGYLQVPEDGVYSFRVWSDDGSRISLNDKIILDNDGPHGNEFKETALGLKAGYHPYLLQFFQGAGGKYLSWDWKKPGDTQFEAIPNSSLYFDKNSKGDVSKLKLPMAVSGSIPGDGSALTEVHPSFDLSQARPSTFTPKVGGLDFMPDGRLVISTWDAAGAVYILENTDQDDPEAITVKQIAEGLAEPLGLKVVDGDIYVMQKQEITRLVDTNGDDIIDEYQTLSNAWGVTNNFHEFGFGLAYKDGYFYATLATGIQPGGAGMLNQNPDRGAAIKISKADGSYERLANGFRTPNGIGLGFEDEIFVADNQGDWLPANKILHVTKGDWFGSRAVDFEGTKDWKEKPPLVWLPQDEIGNSPSTPSYINVGPYKGQMIHGEVTHGGVKRVFVEKINNELQGCVFRFTQGIEAGVNRLAWAPDGSLYLGGIGSSGNWGQTGKLWYGLQRLKYNEKSTFEMLAVRAKTNGLEIELTEPLAIGQGWSADDFLINQWYYMPTADYGGPKMDLETLPILSSSVSTDRKKIFLEIQGIKAGHVVYLKFKNQMMSDMGNSLWSTEAWYTMNNIPQNNMGEAKAMPYSITDNTLNEQEKAQGWTLLFDGKSTDGWRNYRKQTIGSSWKVKDGLLYLDSQKKDDGGWQAADGGDIITDKPYENYELQLEWKISDCGNSGIIFNVVESDDYDYVWQTGPEMQILDNTCHPDTRFVTHRAGDLYDMIECKYSTVKPAGEWNKARIKSDNGHVSFYLNGYKVVDFMMHNDAWKEMIANSKFKDMPGFGLAAKGHIALQDHGDRVYFKNIKIKTL